MTVREPSSHFRVRPISIQLCHLEHVEDEVVRLRDEVDVLRPAESKLVKLEANLARYLSRAHTRVSKLCLRRALVVNPD